MSKKRLHAQILHSSGPLQYCQAISNPAHTLPFLALTNSPESPRLISLLGISYGNYSIAMIDPTHRNVYGKEGSIIWQPC